MNTFLTALTLLASLALAQHHHHEAVRDLSPWSGAHRSATTADAAQLEAVFAAIASATPELATDEVARVYRELSHTDFSTMNVEGARVTFGGPDVQASCDYRFVRSEELRDYPGEFWHLFEGGENCGDYRYLALGLPHASEPGASPHFHMRYGGAGFAALTDDPELAFWYPSLYPEVTSDAEIVNVYLENARPLGRFMAGVLGREVALSDDELAAEGADAHGHADHADHDHADHADHDHADHDHADHEHSEGARGIRLVVSAADDASLRVLDLRGGETLASFGTPGARGRVYASPNGRYALVLHRDENRVSVVYGGLRAADHGDHMDLIQENPYVVATLNVGRQPTHFFAHGDDIVIFNDQDGTIAVLDQRLIGLSLDYAEITTAQPDHGAALAYGDYVFSGHLALDRVDVYRRDGSFVTTIEGCPRLHGEALAGNVAAFGCADGVLLIRVEEAGVTASKLVNPADAPEGARVGTLVADEGSPVLVGNFGEGIALIDPGADQLVTVALPERPLGMRFADSGRSLLVLTADGALHRLEPATGEVLESLQLMEEAALELSESTVVRAALAVRGDYAYASDPVARQLHEIHLPDFELARSLELDFVPFSLTALSIPGAVLHD